MEKEIDYLEEGFVQDSVNAMVALFTGIGVVIIVVILVSLLGGKAHSLVQADLRAIVVDGNSLPGHAPDMNSKLGVEALRDINGAIVNTFGALGDASGFLGIIILAVVFAIVLILLQTTLGASTGNLRGI